MHSTRIMFIKRLALLLNDLQSIVKKTLYLGISRPIYKYNRYSSLMNAYKKMTKNGSVIISWRKKGCVSYVE